LSHEYIPKSIYEGAYLYANGIPLVSVIFRKECRNATFIFDNKDGIARRVSDEYFSDASTPARSLFSALGQLKEEANRAKPKQWTTKRNDEVS